MDIIPLLHPPHTVILSEAKDLDFCCCPSLNNIHNTNIQVINKIRSDYSDFES
jgi:hypothetical protein